MEKLKGKDQYSASVSVALQKDKKSEPIALRVKSPAYIRHLRAIFNLLGKPQVHAVREALDIGVTALVERDARPEDKKVIYEHLEAMKKS